jgi:hypothetical protein
MFTIYKSFEFLLKENKYKYLRERMPVGRKRLTYFIKFTPE